MKLNKKANIVNFLFIILAFIICWVMFLGKLLSTAGTLAIANSGATGLEALLYANLNFVVFIVLILVIVGYSYVAGGQ